MKIALNAVQNTNLNHIKKEPSFQAKLIATPAAKKALEAGLSKGILHGKPLAFNEIFIAYKKSVEEATQGVDGTIKLFVRKRSCINPRLAFIDSEGNCFKRKKSRINRHAELFPKSENNIKAAVMQTIARIGDVMADNGFGYEEKNPFIKMFYELLKP